MGARRPRVLLSAIGLHWETGMGLRLGLSVYVGANCAATLSLALTGP